MRVWDGTTHIPHSGSAIVDGFIRLDISGVPMCCAVLYIPPVQGTLYAGSHPTVAHDLVQFFSCNINTSALPVCPPSPGVLRDVVVWW